DQAWWSDVRVHLHNEPSGIASAFFEAAPVSVYDVESSPLVSQRLAKRAGAKSAAFVPLIVDERVIGVLVAAATGERRAFAADEIRLIEALASEAAIALDRARSASALDRALVLEPIGGAVAGLPVSNLAARERRTVAVPDVLDTPELADPSLGDVEHLSRLGTRAVLATPVIVFDRMIGVLGLHRRDPGPWSSGDVGLAEAVAREIGLALHTARLLEENERRLGEQAALLKAAQTVTSELELDAVLQRLVDEVADLLRAEAVDCFLLDQERGVLRCAAVHGSLEGIVGFEFPADRGLSGRAIARGRP